MALPERGGSFFFSFWFSCSRFDGYFSCAAACAFFSVYFFSVFPILCRAKSEAARRPLKAQAPAVGNGVRLAHVYILDVSVPTDSLTSFWCLCYCCFMRKRSKISRKKSSRNFRSSAQRIHRKNLSQTSGLMRGGIRL